MKRIAWKFAASTAVLAVTSFGPVVTGVGTMPAAASPTSRTDQEAAQLFERAGRAIADNKLAEAVSLLEQAVILSPRDAGYRLLLADAYMKSGRFQSAEAAYRDVLTIDPERARAGLGLALMNVANGRQKDALSLLQTLEGVASAADLGLAYALAGSPKRAVDLLEPAARSMGATARVRQNLALAYAFGGDWQRARTIAAQDVSPAELASRMTQWAAIAQNTQAPNQVAALLGVSPVADAGQPVQVALNPGLPAAVSAPTGYAEADASDVPQTVYAEAEPVPAIAAAPAYAAVEAQRVLPEPTPVIETAAAVPVEQPSVPLPADVQPAAPVAIYAEAEAAAPIGPAAADAAVVASVSPAPVESQAPAAYAELETPEWGLDQRGAVTLPKEAPAAEQAPARVQYAVAAENLVRADPVVMPVMSRAERALAPVAARGFRTAALPGTRSPSGEFVVQIGAFSSAINADRAWQSYEKQFGLRAEQPVTMTIDHRGRLLHRVALSGFVSRKEASQVCRVILSRGGECFVRSNAGDAAISWAARYTRNG